MYTSESKETKERDLVDCLFGVVDLLEETEMGVTLDGVVPIGDHTGESVTDITTLNDSRSLFDVPSKENKRQDNTSSENIL